MPETKLQQTMDLVDELDDDDFSSLIDYIRYTVKARHQRKSAVSYASLKVGDRVRLVGKYKPQYLTGMTGKVEDKLQSRIVVKLDRGPVGKFRDGKVRATAGGLEKIG